MKKFDKKVTIGMSQELYDTLKRLAQEDFRSVPSYILSILQTLFENHTHNPNG